MKNISERKKVSWCSCKKGFCARWEIRGRQRNRNIIEQESTSRAGLVVQTIRSGLEHFFIDQHHQNELLISSSGGIGSGDGGMGKRKKDFKSNNDGASSIKPNIE